MTEPVVDRAAPAAAPEGTIPWLACVLAWLLPGLGHLYLGKKRRAAVFFVVVTATFALGLASDGAASVADPRQPLTYLATADNLATGPLDLVARRLTYGRLVYSLPAEEADEVRIELLGRLRTRVASVTYEYGSTFLLTAGLMNILLILDAFDISTGRKN